MPTMGAFGGCRRWSRTKPAAPKREDAPVGGHRPVTCPGPGDVGMARVARLGSADSGRRHGSRRRRGKWAPGHGQRRYWRQTPRDRSAPIVDSGISGPPPSAADAQPPDRRSKIRRSEHRTSPRHPGASRRLVPAPEGRTSAPSAASGRSVAAVAPAASSRTSARRRAASASTSSASGSSSSVAPTAPPASGTASSGDPRLRPLEGGPGPLDVDLRRPARPRRPAE